MLIYRSIFSGEGPALVADPSFPVSGSTHMTVFDLYLDWTIKDLNVTAIHLEPP
jgi:hypothetical protein